MLPFNKRLLSVYRRLSALLGAEEEAKPQSPVVEADIHRRAFRGGGGCAGPENLPQIA